MAQPSSFGNASQFIQRDLEPDLLRVVICGRIEDRATTLIERLKYDSKPLPKAHLSTHFIVADTSGDDQVLNIVSAASTADVAVILIDTRKGVSAEIRWHTYLVSLLGVRKVVVGVNNLDLVAYSKDVFERIDAAYRLFSDQIGLRDVTCIPLSTLNGDNVTAISPNTPWYGGPTLINDLETVERGAVAQRAFRMPVLSVNDPRDSRVFFGRVASGSVRPGDPVRVVPSGNESTVVRIASKSDELQLAVAGQSVTVTLADTIEGGRGDILSAADAPPGIADQFEATIIWMSDDEMLPGRAYLLNGGASTANVTMATPKYKVNVDTLEHMPAKTLHRNEIGVCNLSLDRPIVFDPYKDNRETGAFILIDRATNHSIGMGLLHFALRRSQNIHWQAVEVNKRARATVKGHKPCVVWFTGLSGSGKSTIANLVEKKLHAMDRHTYLLDGDNIRHGLNKDLGFTEADRVENIRRVAEIARLMVDAGLIVLVSFISPFQAERRFARGLVGADEFCEVFVDTPLHVAEQRDRKGLYKKARRGELKNFTGIDSPYEQPEKPEVRIETVKHEPEDAAETIIAHLKGAGVLNPLEPPKLGHIRGRAPSSRPVQSSLDAGDQPRQLGVIREPLS